MSLSSFIEWLENHRIPRKITLIWAAWLITWTVMIAMTLPMRDPATASIVVAVIGILSVVVKWMMDGDKEGV